MSIYASIHGRLGADPTATTTKTGKDMTRASIAVDVTPYNAEDTESLWVGLLAFGSVAEDLQRAEKGQMVTAQGRMTRGHYAAKDGSQRESWTMIADAVVTARSARPTGKRRQAA
jgi:single-strand DNA-binding protein